MCPVGCKFYAIKATFLRTLCKRRQVPCAARQDLGYSEQLIRAEFPHPAKARLVDDGDAPACDQKEMRCLLACMEQGFAMKQGHQLAVCHVLS